MFSNLFSVVILVVFTKVGGVDVCGNALQRRRHTLANLVRGSAGRGMFGESLDMQDSGGYVLLFPLLWCLVALSFFERHFRPAGRAIFVSPPRSKMSPLKSCDVALIPVSW
jgi:hypothetical protein